MRTLDSFSMTLENGGLFGVALGPAPPVDSRWSSCIVADSAFGTRLDELHVDDFWDFYSVHTPSTRVDGDVVTLTDNAEIAELLQIHAVDSSVWPGDPEVVAWYGLRDENDVLVALGALVRWESGMHVLASITTVTELRGRGYAQELTQGIVARAREQGITWLGLGVAHSNVAAHHVYEKAGFELRARFSVYDEAVRPRTLRGD